MIPITVLVMAIGGVFAYKIYTDSMKANDTEVPVVKTLPPLGDTQGKPAKGYALVAGPASKSGSMLVAEATESGKIDLDTILGEVNDAGEAELKSLDAVVNEL